MLPARLQGRRGVGGGRDPQAKGPPLDAAQRLRMEKPRLTPLLRAGFAEIKTAKTKQKQEFEL